MKGEQHGLSLGLLNTAYDLRGWQLGVLNCVKHRSRWSCYPLVRKGG